jgi:predicted nucleotidyltransferase
MYVRTHRPAPCGAPGGHGGVAGYTPVVICGSAEVDLRPKDFDLVLAILARFGEVRAAILFGSRVQGTARRGSDIDLAVSAPGMSATRWSDLVEAFEESCLPWKTDTVRLDELAPGPLLDSITAGGIALPLSGRAQEVTADGARAHG